MAHRFLSLFAAVGFASALMAAPVVAAPASMAGSSVQTAAGAGVASEARYRRDRHWGPRARHYGPRRHWDRRWGAPRRHWRGPGRHSGYCYRYRTVWTPYGYVNRRINICR